MTEFTDKVVFVTGASSGIGAALAAEFARRGAAVALAARRMPELEQRAAEIRSAGGRALALRCDVTRDGDVERAAAEAHRALGPLDVAVANAGFAVRGPFGALTLGDHRRQIETNVFGVLRTAYAALADLAVTRGSLVIVGSVAGYIGQPGMSSYAMTKFAIRGLAETLRHELASRGVNVILINPGFVRSEMYQVDNEGRRQADARDPVPRVLRMRTARAARRIVSAVGRRRAESMITGHAKLAVFLARHTPWLVAWGIRRLARFSPV